MDQKPTTLERAFALARSGACTSVTEVRRTLKREGYPVYELVGPSLIRQLRIICEEARDARREPAVRDRGAAQPPGP